MFHLCYKELIFLCSSCYSDKTDMAIGLFTALRLEDQSLRLTIQEAATSLAGAYKVAVRACCFLQCALHDWLNMLAL
jgi:hypothetical protein